MFIFSQIVAKNREFCLFPIRKKKVFMLKHRAFKKCKLREQFTVRKLVTNFTIFEEISVFMKKNVHLKKSATG